MTRITTAASAPTLTAELEKANAGKGANGGGVHELGTEAAGSTPAQTAAMEAVWFLGQLAPQADAPAGPGLSEIRLSNRFEELAAEERGGGADGAPAPPCAGGAGHGLRPTAL